MDVTVKVKDTVMAKVEAKVNVHEKVTMMVEVAVEVDVKVQRISAAYASDGDGRMTTSASSRPSVANNAPAYILSTTCANYRSSLHRANLGSHIAN